jgi:hypothetical protein
MENYKQSEFIKQIRWISFYLVIILILYILLFIAMYFIDLELYFEPGLFLNEDLKLLLLCCVLAGLGGTIYCLRGVFEHACRKNDWKLKWNLWYYIRPIFSIGCGIIAFLFLKAGLFLLETNIPENATNIGYLVLSFIAGYSVDSFIERIEEIGKSIFSIKKSNYSSEIDKE